MARSPPRSSGRRGGDARARGRRSRPARQVNAVVGLVGAPIVFLGLAGWALFVVAALRQGSGLPRRPVDPHARPAARPDRRVRAHSSWTADASRRALTTALLDLASRGHIAFREEDRGLLGMNHKVGIEVGPPTGDAVEEAHRARNARRPIGPAERYALEKLSNEAESVMGGEGTYQFISADDLPEKFGGSVSTFDRADSRIMW